jgi:hypothetical protein
MKGENSFPSVLKCLTANVYFTAFILAKCSVLSHWACVAFALSLAISVRQRNPKGLESWKPPARLRNRIGRGVPARGTAMMSATDKTLQLLKVPSKESPGHLVPISANNFDSETFCFPPQNEPPVAVVTFVDLERHTIQFSILQR